MLPFLEPDIATPETATPLTLGGGQTAPDGRGEDFSKALSALAGENSEMETSDSAESALVETYALATTAIPTIVSVAPLPSGVNGFAEPVQDAAPLPITPEAAAAPLQAKASTQTELVETAAPDASLKAVSPAASSEIDPLSSSAPTPETSNLPRQLDAKSDMLIATGETGGDAAHPDMIGDVALTTRDALSAAPTDPLEAPDPLEDGAASELDKTDPAIRTETGGATLDFGNTQNPETEALSKHTVSSDSGATAPIFTASAPAPSGATPAPSLAAPVIVVSAAELPKAMTEAITSVDEQSDRVVVQLDPPELGRVSIDFSFDGSNLQHVTITSETPEALRQLRQMHHQLVQALEQHGLSGDNMSFVERDAGSNSFNQSAGTFAQTAEFVDDIEHIADTTTDAGPTASEPGRLNLKL